MKQLTNIVQDLKEFYQQHSTKIKVAASVGVALLSFAGHQAVGYTQPKEEPQNSCQEKEEPKITYCGLVKFPDAGYARIPADCNTNEAILTVERGDQTIEMKIFQYGYEKALNSVKTNGKKVCSGKDDCKKHAKQFNEIRKKAILKYVNLAREMIQKGEYLKEGEDLYSPDKKLKIWGWKQKYLLEEQQAVFGVDQLNPKLDPKWDSQIYVPIIALQLDPQVSDLVLNLIDEIEKLPDTKKENPLNKKVNEALDNVLEDLK
jgi:hypothetical protein